MTDSTEEILPAGEDSIAADIEAAFDEMEKKTEDEKEIKEPESKAEEDEPSEAVKDTEKPSDVTESEIKVEASTAEAPQHWSAEHKETFSKIPEEHRGFILQRYKEIEGDYTRKSQDLAKQRKRYDSMDEVFEPVRANLNMQGIDEAQLMKQYLAYHQNLQKDPAATLKYLAQQYNVNLGEDAQEEYVDPEIKQLRDQNHQLNQKISNIESQFTQSHTDQARLTLEKFTSEKNEKGELKHPFYNEVRPMMGRFLQSGEAEDINKAYEMAVRVNPVTYQKIVEKQIQDKVREGLKKQNEEQRLKASKANPSALTPSSSGSNSKVALTIEEELEKTGIELGFF